MIERMEGAVIPVLLGMSIGLFVFGIISKDIPKVKPKQSKTEETAKPDQKSKQEREEQRLFDELVKQLEQNGSIDHASLAKKIEDEKLRDKVLMKVKLHFDPTGSKLGKSLKWQADGVSKEEGEFNEMMDGLGKKCIRKLLESMVIAGFVVGALYFTGGIDQAIELMHAMFEKMGIGLL